MKKIIHVNQHVIRRNTKNKTFEPVLTVKTYKENNYAHEAIIMTKEGVELARVVYSPHKPLSLLVVSGGSLAAGLCRV